MDRQDTDHEHDSGMKGWIVFLLVFIAFNVIVYLSTRVLHIPIRFGGR